MLTARGEVGADIVRGGEGVGVRGRRETGEEF